VQSRWAKAVNFLQRLFSSDGSMPHGHCYLWNQPMMWLNVISDGLIAVAYLTIPVTLIYIARKRKDFAFRLDVCLLWRLYSRLRRYTRARNLDALDSDLLAPGNDESRHSDGIRGDSDSAG
jgi:hypothetical protein